jgi:GPH family glycoside/pentoside/hexuronide:cation symporter
VFALSKVGDALSDPIVGYLSDRTRLAAGRRRPWIFAAALPMVLTVWAVWSPPAFLSPRALIFWVGASIVLYYTAYTLAYVPHLALGAELSNDHHERTRVFGARGIFDVLGLLAAAGTVGWLQSSDDPRAVGKVIAVLFAIAAPVFLWGGIARIRERPEYQGRGPEAPFRAFLDVGRNPHARILLGVLVLESLSFSLLGAMFPFVTQYMIPDGAVSARYVGGAMLTALVAFPIWFPLARRFGKREAWLLALALKSVGFVCMLLASPERAWLFPTAVLLIGSALACSIMLPPSIKADVIDYDEFVTGDRKEGAYFAA